MPRTLDMKFIRYLNLFEKITKIRSQHCFLYNSGIIFLVPERMIARALGESGRNIKKISETLDRKIKVIAIPSGVEEIEKFVTAIIYPIKFKSIEVKDNSVVISAGMQSRATLIGRNKTRLNEMKNILKEYFGVKELRIA